MSKKDFHKGMVETATEKSSNESVSQGIEASSPLVFYRVTCPECGGDALNLLDSGVFNRSPVLGVTSNGEVGCTRTELDGDYQLDLMCHDCGHDLFSDQFVNYFYKDPDLIQWAKSNGEAHKTLSFTCPECGSHELSRVEIGLEFWHVVVAACEANSPEGEPFEALSHLRDLLGGGSYRYRCSGKHELTKDDGTPVQTPEELVDWLKAHSEGEKG
jgi:predicted RNA-binding Zn-ribbon protein involved in translation (DUF1610 family)